MVASTRQVKESGIAQLRVISFTRHVVDEKLMLKKRPDIVVTGKMVDWEASTGSYLLQKCLATRHPPPCRHGGAYCAATGPSAIRLRTASPCVSLFSRSISNTTLQSLNSCSFFRKIPVERAAPAANIALR